MHSRLQSPWETQHQPHGRCLEPAGSVIKLSLVIKLNYVMFWTTSLCTYLVDKTIVKEVMQEKEMI